MVAPTIQTSSVSDFGWNEAAGRYVDSSGKFVPFSTIRDEMDNVVKASQSRIEQLSQALVDKSISISEWQTGMMEQIKMSQIASMVSANGGWAQMTPSDWGFAGSQIKPQYEYLQNFANQIESGEQALDGRLLMRADMYGDAARSSFEETRRRSEQANGMNFERRVLGAADHCPDCLEYAAEGWQPIGTLPEIGDSACLTNCYCTFEYSATGDEEAVVDEEDIPGVSSKSRAANDDKLRYMASELPKGVSLKEAFHGTVKEYGGNGVQVLGKGDKNRNPVEFDLTRLVRLQYQNAMEYINEIRVYTKKEEWMKAISGRRFTIDLAKDKIAGFYSPDSRIVHVPGFDSSGNIVIDPYVFTHEVGHAAQDASDLSKQWDITYNENPDFDRHTEYAKNNSNEGFAETYAAWIASGRNSDWESFVELAEVLGGIP